MNNQKMNPIQAIVRLFQPSGRSAAFEESLKAQSKAEAYYTTMPMPRI